MTIPLPAVPSRVWRLRRGYRVAAVNVLVQRVSARLSGFTTAVPVTVDEMRATSFPSQWGGYDTTAVDAVIERLLALMQSSPGVVGVPRGGAAAGNFSPGASGAASLDTVMVHVPGELRVPRFTPIWRPSGSRVTGISGYRKSEVDALVDWLNMACALTDIRDPHGVGLILESLREAKVHTSQDGYVSAEVDAWWQQVDDLLAAALR